MGEFTAGMIRKAAAGDQDAITELYNLTYSGVYKTVRSMIADEDTALDVVQDSYIKGFQSLAQLDTPENYRAWMKRIAVNKAKDHLKKKKPILFSEMAKEDGEEIDFLDDRPEHCPEEVLDRKETARLMQEILATLSEEQRLVIGMFYYEEMSVREIAEVLDCSQNTVKSRLNYGRKKVEVKVRELEKKGTKLYSLAPLPFLLWLFRLDAQAAEIPSGMVLDAVTAECAAAGTAAAGTVGTAAAAGAKALAARIIAGVLAVTVVAGGAVAAVSFRDSREKEHMHQTVPEEMFLPTAEEIPFTTEAISYPPAEAVYSYITNAYQVIVDTDSAEFLENPEDYPNSHYAVVRYYHMYHDGNFYYAYYDIDGNGMEELFIGYGTEGNIRIVELYSHNGVQAFCFIEEPTLGDRSSLTLLEDGTLHLFLGSGAEETEDLYFTLQGTTPCEAEPSNAPEFTGIPWQAFTVSAD